MLTTRGWALLAIGVAALAAAILFAISELAIIGTTVLVLVGAAAVFQAWVRPASRVTRELHPPRVFVGAASRIDLLVENQSRRTTPVLALRDPVSGTRGANLLVQPLRPGASTQAAYQLPTTRRGVLLVGPLDVSVTDPFGLITRSTRSVDPVELTVFPHVDTIEPVPLSSGHDPLSSANHPNALGRSGEDFYALRPYVVGDDLRRVHWRSSARRDDLLVRQDELPWHGRTTVLVDRRTARHTEESFEAAVSAAASIVMASTRRDDLVRLATTDGWESTVSSGLVHADHLLEHLAHLELSALRPDDAGRDDPGPRDPGLGDVIDQISRTSSGGAVIVLTGAMSANDAAQILGLRRRFGSFYLVTFGARTSAETPGVRQIHIGPGASFPRIWNVAVRPHDRPVRSPDGPAPASPAVSGAGDSA